MNPELINEIIAKALSHEATDEEMRLLQDWINQSETNRQLFYQIKHEWHLAKTSNFKIVNGEELKDRIWKMSLEKPILNSGNIQSNNFFIRIAATISIILIAGFLSWFYVNSENELQKPAILSLVQKTTTAGQKSKIFLPDGTEVWLNAESRLAYNENFSDSNRLVHLTGEAFFDVSKEPERPFIVESNGILTRALGTSFNINAYNHEIKVALVEGEVEIRAVNNVSESLLLSPGELARYDSLKAAFELSTFNPLEITSWKEGILYFKDASFPEIIDKLKLWYGVEVEMNGKKPPQKHYTGKFNNESLKNVMENISFALNFNFEIVGKELKINFE